MARMYPNRLSDETASPAESRLFHLFQTKLDQSYSVFHGVKWQAMARNGSRRDGEADFVLAHPQKGVLVLEVKGGAVRFDPEKGHWVSLSGKKRTHKIKDPFEQAKTSKYALLTALNRVDGQRKQIAIGHAVAFPDAVAEKQTLGSDRPAQIVLDKRDTVDIQRWVDNAMQFWTGQADGLAPEAVTLDRLMTLLGTRKELRPALWGDIIAEQEQLLQLTEQQFDILNMLANHNRATIAGFAGSGKTLVAVEKAIRLAAQGFRVLFTCYNRKLADHIKSRLGNRPNLTCANFHKLCFDVAKQADLLPQAERGMKRYYDEQLPTLLPKAAKRLGLQFDAIVVDEGQDFRPNWANALMRLLSDRDQGIFYLFYDDNQQLYDVAQQFPISSPPYNLTINCRNTQKIHEQVRRFYRGSVDAAARGPQGRPVSLVGYANPNQLLASMVDQLRFLMRDERIPAEQITILTPRAKKQSILWSADHFGRIRLSDAWPCPAGASHISTIHSFKGLENSVVVLAELEQLPRSKDLDALLYVACSRAKNHLVVLLPDTLAPTLQTHFS